MEIKEFFGELMVNLEAELELVSPENEPKLITLESSFLLVDNKIKELKRFVLDYKFQSIEEEIFFFKELTPQLLSRSVYFSELFSIEANRPIAEKKVQKQYLSRELGNIQRFMWNHHQFYNYILLKKSNFDHLYFLRDNALITGLSGGLGPALDERFCTPHCLLKSKILACIKINYYLHHEIDLLKNGRLPSQENKASLSWTAPKVYLVELIYALKAVGALNSGNAEIKEIALFMESLLPKKLTDYYRTFQEIRLRKKNRTVFLDLLRERLIRFMEEGEGI
jgi:hypothetical protein